MQAETTQNTPVKKGHKKIWIALCASFITPILIILFLFMAVMGFAIASDNTNTQTSPNGIGELVNVSQEVLQYKEDVLAELSKHGLEKYLNLVLAIMMQESGGRVPDVMQSSESLGLAPNSLKDPQRSIEAGVNYIAGLEQKRIEYDVDLNTLIQSYNFGSYFMTYIKNNGKVFSTTLAQAFSTQQANKQGWSKYGDVKYVEHVRRYLSDEKGTVENHDKLEVIGDFGRPLADTNYRSFVNVHFGSQTIGGAHRGTDFRRPAGTPVYATMSGTVKVSYHYSWGNNVLLSAGNVTFRYAHLSGFAVSNGQSVEAGQVIGYVGTTGTSTGNHLHLEMTVNGQLVNCLNYLP